MEFDGMVEAGEVAKKGSWRSLARASLSTLLTIPSIVTRSDRLAVVIRFHAEGKDYSVLGPIPLEVIAFCLILNQLQLVSQTYTGVWRLFRHQNDPTKNVWGFHYL